MKSDWDVDLQQVIEQLPGYVVWKDKNSIIRGCNEGFAKWCGKPIKELIGRPLRDLYPKAFGDRYRAEDLEVIHTGRGMIYLEEKPHGKMVEKIVTYKYPLRNGSGKIVGTVVFFHELQENWMDEKRSA